MALADLWKSSPEQFIGKNVQQVLTFAGDGTLRDENATSSEFRELLEHVPSETLADFADQCLDSPFKDSGLALQDIINQVGRRLGFQVIPGRYRGTSNESTIGFDGLWRSPDNDAIIVEVKTTDAYRVSLDVAAGYRKKLIQQGTILSEKSSILYIVGRKDTGDLEAQVRGSRHAWDIRLISVEWLLRLMKLKEELEDPKIMEKIRDVLTPREFTRVDGIIELVFSTAEEVKKEEEVGEGDDVEKTKETTKKFTPVAFRSECVARISKHLGETLVKRSAATFTTPDDKKGITCAISKEYDNPGHTNYWFAFHPSQKESLEQLQEAYACFGCGSAQQILIIPRDVFFSWLTQFNQTIDGDRFYWHVHIFHKGGAWSFHTKGGQEKIEATKYLISG